MNGSAGLSWIWVLVWTVRLEGCQVLSTVLILCPYLFEGSRPLFIHLWNPNLLFFFTYTSPLTLSVGVLTLTLSTISHIFSTKSPLGGTGGANSPRGSPSHIERWPRLESASFFLSFFLFLFPFTPETALCITCHRSNRAPPFPTRKRTGKIIIGSRSMVPAKSNTHPRYNPTLIPTQQTSSKSSCR